MKRPKEPRNFKYPRIYYQEGLSFLSMVKGPRVRIFYPNGDTDWATIADHYCGNVLPLGPDYLFETEPCWYVRKNMETDGFEHRKPNTMKKAIMRANEFDKKEGFPKMIFLGEIK